MVQQHKSVKAVPLPYQFLRSNAKIQSNSIYKHKNGGKYLKIIGTKFSKCLAEIQTKLIISVTMSHTTSLETNGKVINLSKGTKCSAGFLQCKIDEGHGFGGESPDFFSVPKCKAQGPRSTVQSPRQWPLGRGNPPAAAAAAAGSLDLLVACGLGFHKIINKNDGKVAFIGPLQTTIRISVLDGVILIGTL
jgi:hypothetical protein